MTEHGPYYGLTPKEERFGALAWEEPLDDVQHEPEAPAPDPKPEPEPDRASDPAYIQVRTQEFIDGATLGQATAGLNIATGRVLITYRLRVLPDEADLDHVVGEPRYPVAILEPKSGPKQGNERDSDWKPGVDPALLRRFVASQQDDTPERSDALSFGRWMRGGFSR